MSTETSFSGARTLLTKSLNIYSPIKIPLYNYIFLSVALDISCLKGLCHQNAVNSSPTTKPLLLWSETVKVEEGMMRLDSSPVHKEKEIIAHFSFFLTYITVYYFVWEKSQGGIQELTKLGFWVTNNRVNIL